LRKQTFLRIKDIDLTDSAYEKELGGERERVEIEDANVIASRIGGGRDHFPVLDLDIPHWYVQSSTPGHAHLILGVRVTRDGYDKLLTALERAGIIQYGFAESGRRSEFGTTVRLPWIKKGDG
jgi:hypothetical protein